MEIETFLQLPVEEVAQLVKANGPKVCVFPINGTRRWFTLEYGQRRWEDPVQAYMDLASENHIGLYRLFFEHGVETLITPAFGPDLLLRSDEYVRRVGAGGLARLAEHPTFLNFYDEYDVRVHFYGDHRRFLAGTEFEYLSDLFDAATERTKGHQRYRLFFGIFANDATQTIAEYSAHVFEQHGRVPDKRELIEMYYGEYVEPVSFFIGFDRFSVFDMPLLATGDEDLYFTISPSPYMDQSQLRRILFDHIYARRSSVSEYTHLHPEQLQRLQDFYSIHRQHILGTGRVLDGIWIPNLYQ